MKRARPLLLFAALAVALPLGAYAAIVAWLHGADAATVMLGAASGTSAVSLAGMTLALLLRVYTVVLMPGFVLYAIARALISRAGA